MIIAACIKVDELKFVGENYEQIKNSIAERRYNGQKDDRYNKFMANSQMGYLNDKGEWLNMRLAYIEAKECNQILKKKLTDFLMEDERNELEAIRKNLDEPFSSFDEFLERKLEMANKKLSLKRKELEMKDAPIEVVKEELSKVLENLPAEEMLAYNTNGRFKYPRSLGAETFEESIERKAMGIGTDKEMPFTTLYTDDIKFSPEQIEQAKKFEVTAKIQNLGR
ncbi:MAG: hypothetical protein FWE47_02445 [Oscillospiraceae bacterium]|nr:hypothetical protein [Oscillospiraceae bacterium]